MKALSALSGVGTWQLCNEKRLRKGGIRPIEILAPQKERSLQQLRLHSFHCRTPFILRLVWQAASLHKCPYNSSDSKSTQQ